MRTRNHDLPYTAQSTSQIWSKTLPKTIYEYYSQTTSFSWRFSGTQERGFWNTFLFVLPRTSNWPLRSFAGDTIYIDTDPHIFQKSSCHFKILSTIRVTRSKLHTKDQQILGITVHNLVARDLCTPAYCCKPMTLRSHKVFFLYFGKHSKCWKMFLKSCRAV